ncbi:DUF1642 domain-containing protein [Streptococcus oralis]|uniref:DUF1642 domain-containing protein n=1 Tax=Streptococcus oralis TaxID=1303 RepID=UPI002000F60B|nr:DUF1642 domain-containing protein [Streptococcus oralis]
MKLKELIKRIEDLPYTEGPIADTITINRDWILESIEQLDEPEAGNADEAPRYLKNILARLRELTLHDREVWLKAIMGEFEQDFSLAKWREGYEQGKFVGEWVGQQLKDADKILQELNKPVIPQFVADWIEECKAKEKRLLTALLYTPEKINSWVDNSENQELFALAWMFGYTVENEKRYLVKVKGIVCNSMVLKHNINEDTWYMSNKTNYTDLKSYHTRKELEQAKFDWVFDCEGVEVEEVEG